MRWRVIETVVHYGSTGPAWLWNWAQHSVIRSIVSNQLSQPSPLLDLNSDFPKFATPSDNTDTIECGPIELHTFPDRMTDCHSLSVLAGFHKVCLNLEYYKLYMNIQAPETIQLQVN